MGLFVRPTSRLTPTLRVGSRFQQPANKPGVWVFSTYLAEGLPYSIIRILSSVFFTDIGSKERYIGYLNFLGIPWNLKFLWAPLLDILGKKRTWMIAVQGLITLLIIGLSYSCFFAARQTDPTWILAIISLTFILLAFLSATNDIAIDGYYMEGLTDPKEQAAYTGYRVFAYRMAVILVRSGFVALAAYAAARLGGADKFQPWGYAFGAGAVTMLLLTLFHFWQLPRFEKDRVQEGRSISEIIREFVRAFGTYFEQERVVLVILFIITYKIGDEILFSMGTPFLMRELGVTKAQLSWLGGILGALGAIAGTSLGGIWIKKRGLKKSIWPLTVLMNFNIWAYVWLAWSLPSASTSSGLIVIALVHCYEQMAAGLGNAVLIVFILRTCKPEFKASHYAVGSAIMSLFSTFFGGFGGVMVEKMGYLNLFILAFLASIPAMSLMFWVPIKEEGS
jgi:MFS transporter, PAT family, beta-lactamase induction signal transducer AmpG